MTRSRTGVSLAFLVTVLTVAGSFWFWYRQAPVLQKLYLKAFVRSSFSFSLTGKVKPKPYWVLAHGHYLATETDLEDQKSPVQWQVISLPPKQFHELLSGPVYGGSLLHLWIWPLSVSGGLALVAFLWGMSWDGKQAKIWRNPGQKLKGRKLLTPQQLHKRENPWWKPKHNGLEVWTED